MSVSVDSVVKILIVIVFQIFFNLHASCGSLYSLIFEINQNWVQELILAWDGFDPNDNDPFKFGTAASVAILTQLNTYTNISK